MNKSALLIIAYAASVASAHAETLRDALAQAYRSNPALLGQRATQRATDETDAQARAGWRPVVSIAASPTYLRESDEAANPALGTVEGNNAQAALTATQPLYTGGRVRNAVRAADARIQAGQEGLRLVEAQTFEAVILAYMDVVRDQDILQVRRADLKTLQRQVQETESRFKLGAQTTRTDVAQAQAQRQAAQAALAAAEAQVATSRANYLAAVGVPPRDLLPPDGLPDVPPSLAAALAKAKAANPALAQSVKLAAASAADVATARSGTNPTINLQASIGTIGPVVPLHGNAYIPQATAMVTLTQPLFAGGLVESQIRQAQARHEADEQAIGLASRQVTQAVTAAWEQAEAGAQEIIANKRQVEAAGTALEGYQLEYGDGLRTTLDVLIADENLRSAQVALAQSRHDAIVAQAALLAAIGELEARVLLRGDSRYDAQANFHFVRNAGSVPWEGVVNRLDHGGED
jgi:outer membrane protein